MITTLHRLAAHLRRWQHKQRIRRRIAEGHRIRAQRAEQREIDVLRHDALVLLSVARAAVGELPEFRKKRYSEKLAKLSERIETK